MRILCCGDRNWTDRAVIEHELEDLPYDTIVIHGACRGADNIAGSVAHRFGYKVERYLALWSQYGKAAGPIRNQQMIDEGTPDSAPLSTLPDQKCVEAIINQLIECQCFANMLGRERNADST